MAEEATPQAPTPSHSTLPAQNEQAATNGDGSSNGSLPEAQYAPVSDNNPTQSSVIGEPQNTHSQSPLPSAPALDPVHHLAAASQDIDASQAGVVDQAAQFQALQQFNNDQGPYGELHPISAQHTPTPASAHTPAPVTHITQYYGELPGGGFSDGFELVTDESAANRMKRDVKRRTKTGCLTCRKRRIKCDERHPVCRNCEKSKRDCLGYDPVFRSQPGPSTLQPAPSHPSLQVAPQNPHQVPGAGQAHFVAGVAHSVSPSLHTAAGSSASPPQEKLDFGTEPDPTPLAAQAQVPSRVSTQDPAQTPSEAATSVTIGVPEGTPLISVSTSLPGTEKMEARQPKMSELLTLGGFTLPNIDHNPLSPTKLGEVKMLYKIYALGMDRMLECNWYDAHGLPHLLANSRLVSLYSSLLDGFTDPNIHDEPVIARMESFEAHVIWESLCLCRTARAQEKPNGNTVAAPDAQLTYAVKRLSLLETLLTGTVLENNPVARTNYPEDDPSVSTSGLGNQMKNRQLQFWEAIGDYLSVADSDQDSNNKREKHLFAARAYLDMIENRDIIYSIAVVRNISKFQPKKFKLQAASDEKDPAAKLYVACRFLEDEVRGKATNQVPRRISQLAVKYWDEPFNA